MLWLRDIIVRDKYKFNWVIIKHAKFTIFIDLLFQTAPAIDQNSKKSVNSPIKIRREKIQKKILVLELCSENYQLISHKKEYKKEFDSKW